MLTSKQRAQLRGLFNGADTIIHVGKGGITPALVKQADDALTARELVKGKVQENSELTSREAGEILADQCGAETVQIIGSKFVLFRENKKLDKSKRIIFIKD